MKRHDLAKENSRYEAHTSRPSFITLSEASPGVRAGSGHARAIRGCAHGRRI